MQGRFVVQVIVTLVVLTFVSLDLAASWNTYISMRDEVNQSRRDIAMLQTISAQNKSTTCDCLCGIDASFGVICVESYNSSAPLCGHLEGTVIVDYDNATDTFSATRAFDGVCDVYSITTNDYTAATASPSTTLGNCTFTYSDAELNRRLERTDDVRKIELGFTIVGTVLTILFLLPARFQQTRAKYRERFERGKVAVDTVRTCSLGPVWHFIRRYVRRRFFGEDPDSDTHSATSEDPLAVSARSAAAISDQLRDEQKRAAVATMGATLLEDDGADDDFAPVNVVVMPVNLSSSVLPARDSQPPPSTLPVSGTAASILPADPATKGPWYSGAQLSIALHTIRDIPQLVIIVLYTARLQAPRGLQCALCIATAPAPLPPCAALSSLVADPAIALSLFGVFLSLLSTAVELIVKAEVWLAWRRSTACIVVTRDLFMLLLFAASFIWMWYILFFAAVLLVQPLRDILFPNAVGVIIYSIASCLLLLYWIVACALKRAGRRFELSSYFEIFFLLTLLRNEETTRRIDSVRKYWHDKGPSTHGRFVRTANVLCACFFC